MSRALAASYAGYALLGIGILLLLTWSTPVAVACLVLGVAVLLVAGVWARPFSPEAYQRRVERTLTEWTGAVDSVAEESPEEIEAYGRWALDRIERMRVVPASRREVHDRLVRALAAYLDALDGGDEEAILDTHAELDRELEEFDRLGDTRSAAGLA